MINIKIDVNKIDKDKLFKGEKGTYLDLVLIETPNNQYGQDYMAVQSISKEEREAGKKGNILGSAKVFKKQEKSMPDLPSTDDMTQPQTDDLPF